MTDPLNRRHLCIACLLALAALAAHGRDIGFDFTALDDGIFFFQNKSVNQGLTWRGWVYAWTDLGTQDANWVPLARLSHMLDFSIFGPRKWGHHLVNVLLHAANAALLFLALRALTGAVWRSAAAGLLLAIHPVHVESIAWVAERRDVLSLFFGCLALWAYARYARPLPTRNDAFPAPARPRLGAYLLVFLATSAAVFAKPTMVTLPCVMMLLDLWPLRRWPEPSTANRLRNASLLMLEKLPLFAPAVLSSVMTLMAQYHAMSSLHGMPLWLRLITVIRAYAAYLGMLVWPVNLLPLYVNRFSWTAWGVGAQLWLLVVISYVAVRLRRDRPYLLVGWLWFLGSLVPMIGLIQVGVQVYAARYAYYTFIGLYIIIAWGLADLLRAIPASTARRLALTATLCIAAGGIAGSWIASGRWASDVTLFEPAMRGNPPHYLTIGLYAGAIDSAGEHEKAETYYRLSLNAQLAQGKLITRLGELLLLRQQTAESRRLANFATRIKGLATAKTYSLLGRLDMRKGDPNAALAHLLKSIEMDPEDSAAVAALGTTYEKLGNPDEALASYKRSIALNPDDPGVQLALGRLLLRLQRPSEAIEPLRHAETTKDSDAAAAACSDLAIALARLGRTSEAAESLRHAVRLRPDWPQAWNNLGAVLGNLGEWKESITAFEQAVRLDPNYGQAVRNLADARALLNPPPKNPGATQPATQAVPPVNFPPEGP